MKKVLLNIGLPIGFLIIAIVSIGPGCNDFSGLATANIDNDGHVFPTVTIGTQKWAQKNLDVSKYRNGDIIPEVTDPTAWAGLSTGAWCYYQNDSANGIIYGRLYNWYAVTDPRGLASQGWHVATDTDWTTLTNYLGGDAVAGGKMKETGTTHWISPNNAADNSKGFTGIPGGYYKESGGFYDIGISSYWWSSTENNPTTAWNRSLNNSDGIAYKSFSNKNAGFSVRCVKD